MASSYTAAFRLNYQAQCWPTPAPPKKAKKRKAALKTRFVEYSGPKANLPYGPRLRTSI